MKYTGGQSCNLPTKPTVGRPGGGSPRLKKKNAGALPGGPSSLFSQRPRRPLLLGGMLGREPKDAGTMSGLKGGRRLKPSRKPECVAAGQEQTPPNGRNGVALCTRAPAFPRRPGPP